MNKLIFLLLILLICCILYGSSYRYIYEHFDVKLEEFYNMQKDLIDIIEKSNIENIHKKNMIFYIEKYRDELVNYYNKECDYYNVKLIDKPGKECPPIENSDSQLEISIKKDYFENAKNNYTGLYSLYKLCPKNINIPKN